MAKNKIVVDSETGLVLGAIFDDPDLTKTSADIKGELKVINNKMTLLLNLTLNDKFEVSFVERKDYEKNKKMEE